MEIKSLVFKYLERNVVLSIAIKAADTFSVGPGWQPAFADVAVPPYLLHKACTISELTVCLDQCDADGKIQSYQVLHYSIFHHGLYLAHLFI